MIKIKRLRDVKLPTRGTERSAGIDFYVPNNYAYELGPFASVNIPSGITAEIPKGHMLLALEKSGVSTKTSTILGAKVIDEDYQGEIHIHVINPTAKTISIPGGMKLAQFILVPIMYAEIVEVEEIHLTSTERGAGGFGSTGL